MLNFQFTLNTHCGLYLALKVSLEKGGLFLFVLPFDTSPTYGGIGRMTRASSYDCGKLWRVFHLLPTPKGVERLIAPGVNPGQVTTMIPGTPEGFNKLCFLNVTLPFDKPAYRIGGLHSLKFTRVLKSNGLWITSQSNYIRRFS